MEELLELPQYVEQKRYGEALNLIAEMEEMSRDDKVNKIGCFAEVLFLHLIKQAAEKRTTRSWDLSIRNAVRQIQFVNRRRRTGGTYLAKTELSETLAEAYPAALGRASLDVFEGRFEEDELSRMVDRPALERRALELIGAEV